MRGRSRWLSAAVVVLLVAAVPAVALGQGGRHQMSSKSKPPRQGEYRGRTTQGYRVIFDVREHALGLHRPGGRHGGRRDVRQRHHRLLHRGPPSSRCRKTAPCTRSSSIRSSGRSRSTGTVIKDSGSGIASMAVPLLNKERDRAGLLERGRRAGKPARRLPAGPHGTATTHAAYRVHVTQSASGRARLVARVATDGTVRGGRSRRLSGPPARVPRGTAPSVRIPVWSRPRGLICW